MEERKRKAKEAPKPRLLWLLAMIAVFIWTPLYFSSMPVWACILLGIFGADLFYFLFVVLKVQRNVSVKAKGTTGQERQAKENAKAVAREIAGEGIVLLKNEDSLLPLARGSRLNLIGLRAVQMCYNGGGSASSDESDCIRLEDALRDAGFQLNTDMLNLSYNYLKNGSISIEPPGKRYQVKQGNSQRGGAEFMAKPGNPVKSEIAREALTVKSLYGDGCSILEHCHGYSDTALVVLSRGGGEGYELDPADLRLIESEKTLLDEVCAVFEKVILVLNMVNTIEMGWLNEYPSIKAVLWIGFPGTAGNLALGDILNGTVNPSGHLPDTWLTDHFAAPAAHNYCQAGNDGRWQKDNFHYQNAPEGTGYFIHYSEGIYVGYRFFETRVAVDGNFPYDRYVVWPFGHGLGYTEFCQKIEGISQKDDALCLTVGVENTGKRSGKCTVQCYYTPPYTGRIERSAVNLAAFVKTALLAPGEKQSLTMEIPKRDLAGFDEKTGKWILEKGRYVFSIRENAHVTIEETEWYLDSEILYAGSRALFADADTESLTRDFPDEHRAFTGPRKEDFIADETILEALRFHVPTDSELGYGRDDVPETGKFAGIKLRDLKDTPKNAPEWNAFIRQMTVSELANLCGNGAWQTIPLPHLGVPGTISPDGPTSMSATIFSSLVMGTGKTGIIWPSPAILAASFNRRVADAMGKGVGQEGRAMGYAGWYAPAMNCHRTPFNSRNFEYYSEDPLLSGRTAAAVVKAAQEQGVAVYVKHFALNEREANARNQLFTWCGEQAMREIYLKPFEIAVKEGGALGVMSCFNYIGHTWAGGSRALLTELLKEEWGFEGAVVTDACLYPHMDVRQMVYAGGDLSLDTLGGFTGGNGKRKNLLAASQDPERKAAMIRWLQDSAKDILFMVSRTWKVRG